MDRIIEVKVSGSHLAKDNRYAGVQHEANAKSLRIEFDEGWDGYAKKVTFWDATGGNPVERTLTTDLLEDMTASTRIYLCPIPGEAMAESGELTFVIDGYVDGKRQRSVSDTLIVEAAPFIDKADQPADPTPTQAEQLQKQIDGILPSMQEQARIATDKAVEAGAHNAAAQTAKSEAENAAKTAEECKIAAAASATDSANSAKVAANRAAYVEGVVDGAVEEAAASLEKRMSGYVDDAEAAKNAAEKARDEAQAIAGGDFATHSEAQAMADKAEGNANAYTDRKFAAIPTPDVSGQIGVHNADSSAHSDIRKAASDAQTAASNAASAAAAAQNTADSKATIAEVNAAITAAIGNAIAASY
jgi:hypothetical protein